MGRGKKRPKNVKRRVKIKGIKIPKKGESVSALVKKYWVKRYQLFSRYDEGIKMDEEGWFSVTPEPIAARQAHRCSSTSLIIDGFTGVAGNAIQFASMRHHVITIDIHPERAALALNNATVYGVEDYIDFVVGDFFQLAPTLKGDKVFVSPPWGGPSYASEENFTLDLLKPKDGYKLFQVAQTIAPNIMMFLPKNIDLHQVEELSWLSSPPLDVEIEEHLYDGKSKAITAYFSDVAFSE